MNRSGPRCILSSLLEQETASHCLPSQSLALRITHKAQVVKTLLALPISPRQGCAILKGIPNRAFRRPGFVSRTGRWACGNNRLAVRPQVSIALTAGKWTLAAACYTIGARIVVVDFRDHPGRGQPAWICWSDAPLSRISLTITTLNECAVTLLSMPACSRCLLFAPLLHEAATGVETVTELREFLMHLREEQYDSIAPDEVRTVLVEIRDRVLPQMDRTLSRTALRRMRRMGIGLMLNTTVTDLTAVGLEFADGKEPLPAETVVWAAGVQAHPVLDHLALEKDRMGRIVVDSDLCVPGMPYVYGLGDAAQARHPETGEV